MAKEKPAVPAKPGFEPITWTSGFLDKHWTRLPPAARVVSYFVILGVFVLLAVEMTYGHRILHGSLHFDGTESPIPELDQRRFAVSYRQMAIGTTGSGEFIVPMESLDYLTMKAKSAVSDQTVPLVLRYQNQAISCQAVPLEAANQLVGISVRSLKIEGATGARGCRRVVAEAPGIGIISTALADGDGAGDGTPLGYRLFVRNLAPAGTALRDIYLEYTDAKGEKKDVPLSFRGVPASMSASRDKSRVEPFDMYFPLPRDIRLPMKMTLVAKQNVLLFKMRGDIGWIMMDVGLAGWTTGRLSDGSEFQAALYLPYDVLMFAKDDIARHEKAIELNLMAQGYLVTRLPSALSVSGETNGVFAGSAVPLDAVKRVVSTVHGLGLPLKVIQPRLSLRSGNPYEIQIGGSLEAAQHPVLTRFELQEFLDAKDGDAASMKFVKRGQ